MAELSENRRIVIIESDQRIRREVESILESGGYSLLSFADVREASPTLRRRQHDALLVSLDWPTPASASSIRALKRLAGPSPIMVLTAPNRIIAAVRALRHGAVDYLIRPPDPVELKTKLRRILERRELDSRLAFFQDELSKRAIAKKIEAHSPSMKELVDRLMRVAPSRSTVLIFGESGVGKELVARSIHFNSPRRERPFIALNCAAMPASLIESELFGHEKGSFTGAHARVRGKFEIAHRGTLFLDEIGEMDKGTQAKLLRVLDEREFMRVGGNQSVRVDVRLVAATNADLERMVEESTFRQDLYYRLKVVGLRVPPLRERRLDIPYLIDAFLDELSGANAVRRKSVAPAALAALRDHNWPGNVRELKNLLESLLVTTPGDEIAVDDLPRAVSGAQASSVEFSELLAGETLEQMERALIRRTLEHTGGNRTHSAALLGIGVRTLQRKMQAYDIRIRSTRRGHRNRRSS